jgi:hypothetical protein
MPPSRAVVNWATAEGFPTMATKQRKEESKTLNPQFFPTWWPTMILLQAVAISALLTKGVFTGPGIALSMVFKVKAKS